MCGFSVCTIQMQRAPTCPCVCLSMCTVQAITRRVGMNLLRFRISFETFAEFFPSRDDESSAPPSKRSIDKRRGVVARTCRSAYVYVGRHMQLPIVKFRFRKKDLCLPTDSYKISLGVCSIDVKEQRALSIALPSAGLLQWTRRSSTRKRLRRNRRLRVD